MVEAIAGFTAQSPGCRQGTILVPMVVWQLLPGSGPFWPWDILDRRRDLRAARSRGQRHDRRQGSGERLKRTWRLAPHRAITLWSRRRAFRGRATPAWRAEGARAAARRRDRSNQTSSDVTGRDRP